MSWEARATAARGGAASKIARFSAAAVFVALVTYLGVGVGASGCGDCTSGVTCEIASECPSWNYVCTNGEAGVAEGCSGSGCCREGTDLCGEICEQFGAEIERCALWTEFE
ncbi:hypothetical protein [Sorangium sp. So ce131]|uniref:hypothetical protein n=1 Tax=Sorangium sp. So ce131 TaxID=3133282 RepID=UPI003F5F6772